MSARGGNFEHGASGGRGERRNAEPRFHGDQTVAPAEAVEAWASSAVKGDSFTYCSAIELIRGETSAKVRELVQRGLVTSHQRRRAGGGWEFFVLRTGLVLKSARRQRDPAADVILAALKRAANLGLACPSDAELARRAGLSTRDQAQWRVRKLADDGVIELTLAHENGVPTRVVTIKATGKRTALPPKWAALERATRQDVRAQGGGEVTARGKQHRAVLAVYRPLERDIALFVEDGDRHSATAISVVEARAIHGALGLALRVADSAGDPVSAVPRSIAGDAATRSSPGDPTGARL